MKKKIGDIARSSGAYDMVEPVYSRGLSAVWRLRGAPIPAPSCTKRAIIRDVARMHGIKVLVETGTYKGDTVRALRGSFSRIYSIELDPLLYRRAIRRCRNQQNVVLIHGDSGVELPSIVSELGATRAVFWLDAHYSGGSTAAGDRYTPITAELKAIFAARAGHVVLVDDMRDFEAGSRDYPALGQVERVAADSGYVVHGDMDIIRLTPSQETDRSLRTTDG